MDFIDSQSATKLREIIDALERLEAQKAVLQEEMRDILKDASNDGFDPKIIKQVMKIKKNKRGG